MRLFLCLRIFACIFPTKQAGLRERDLIDANHLVLLVGWNDERQAWLIKNSYDMNWGEKGFGWVKYGSNNIGQFAAWILADPNEKMISR